MPTDFDNSRFAGLSLLVQREVKAWLRRRAGEAGVQMSDVARAILYRAYRAENPNPNGVDDKPKGG